MALIRQSITDLHEVCLFAVRPDGGRPADRLLEVRVDRRFLLGVHPLQRNGAPAVHALHIPFTSSREKLCSDNRYHWRIKQLKLMATAITTDGLPLPHLFSYPPIPFPSMPFPRIGLLSYLSFSSTPPLPFSPLFPDHQSIIDH